MAGCARTKHRIVGRNCSARSVIGGERNESGEHLAGVADRRFGIVWVEGQLVALRRGHAVGDEELAGAVGLQVRKGRRSDSEDSLGHQ